MSDEEIRNVGREVSNNVYKAVIEHIQKYEKRGFNSHHRAQHICEYAKQEVINWLEIQYTEPKDYLT